MEFSSNRRKAAALVVLVFVLGVAFGIVGVLAGRRVLSAGRRNGGNGQGTQQISDLARELHLTADQEGQFRRTLADTRERYNTIRDSMNPQFRQIREQNRDRIRQILTTDQKPLFEEFLRESGNRRGQQDGSKRNDPNNRNGRNDQNGNRNDAAPLVSRLTQELRLTGEQQAQLSGILTETRASFDAVRQEMNPQFEEARLQNRERLRQLVTPEQRQGLDAFFQRRDEERRRK